MKTKLILISLLAISANSYALTTIANNGNAVSSQPYIEAMRPSRAIATNLNQQEVNRLGTPPAQVQMKLYPVVTKNMTPGIIKPRKVDLPLLSQPIFLVGDDSLSKTWLLANKPELVKLKAVGLLVKAINAADYEEMQDMAKPLQLLPVSGTPIAKNLNLKHYPVLITNKEVDQ